MKYACNPLNIRYRYQFVREAREGCRLRVFREAADPSLILFKGRYYLFSSMSLSVWVSDDLTAWTCHDLPEALPLYDYAPDVRVRGEWVYFCASRRDGVCDRWRTKDILSDQWEKIPGTFAYWDPNLFVDEDGRMYFYWGCSNSSPIFGVEIDPVTMVPVTEPKALICGHPEEIGYERTGEDHCQSPATDEEITASVRGFLQATGGTEDQVPPDIMTMLRDMFSRRPYIEGAWMDKHNGRYYLQYAAPGTEYNVYGDGVYISDSPLGPFTLAENNPYSYKPGGFIPGAGHGSTLADKTGAIWHTSTMRISMNHSFERRVGLWPAGWDRDGELFCNQRYGDWPFAVSKCAEDSWSDPEWMLLSAGKQATASSYEKGREPEKAVEENVRTWWQAEASDRNSWLKVDLGEIMSVHAVQVNFADGETDIPCPGKIVGGDYNRFIDPKDEKTRWKLAGSADGENWFIIEDKTNAETDLPHDLVVREEGFKARWLRLSEMSVPYGQVPCVSGLRVFGKGNGVRPASPQWTVERIGEMNADVVIDDQKNTVGYNILFGNTPDKLYHSKMVFTSGKHRIGALVKGRSYCFRVDAFNENGITEGAIISI